MGPNPRALLVSKSHRPGLERSQTLALSSHTNQRMQLGDTALVTQLSLLLSLCSLCASIMAGSSRRMHHIVCPCTQLSVLLLRPEHSRAELHGYSSRFADHDTRPIVCMTQSHIVGVFVVGCNSGCLAILLETISGCWPGVKTCHLHHTGLSRKVVHADLQCSQTSGR